MQSDYLMQVDWEKCALQELDITATDLSTECLQDMLTRLPGLRFLSAGQLNGFNDSVLKTWMEVGNPRNLVIINNLFLTFIWTVQITKNIYECYRREQDIKYF